MPQTTKNEEIQTAGLLSGFYTKPGLASELKIATKTLDRWEREGRGPAPTKLGKRVFYKRSTVEAWLLSREQARKLGTRRSNRPV